MPPGPASIGQNRGPPPTRGLNRSIQPLNVSTISQGPPPKLVANGGARMSSMLNTTPLTSCSSNHNHSNLNLSTKHRVGAREALTSLGLLCLGELIPNFNKFIVQNKTPFTPT